MSVFIKMRDEIDPIEVPGDALPMMNRMNNAAANGMMFALVGDDDDPIVINLNNVNSIRGSEDAVYS